MTSTAIKQLCKELLHTLRQSPKEYEQDLLEKRQQFEKTLSSFSPIKLLAFSGLWWSVNNSDFAHLLPFFWARLIHQPSLTSEKTFDINEAKACLASFKELFLKESIKQLFSSFPSISSNEVYRSFSQLLRAPSFPHQQKIEARLHAFSQHQKECLAHLTKEKQRLQGYLEKLERPFKLEDFEIHPGASQDLIEALSYSLDEAAPLSVPFYQSLFSHQQKVYCFSPLLLNEGILTQALMGFSSPNQQELVLKNYRENELYSALSHLFSSENIYVNVQLKDTHPNSSISDVEADLLVIYDHVILAFSLSPLISLKKEDNLNHLIEGILKTQVEKQKEVMEFLSATKHFAIHAKQGELFQVIESARLEKGYMMALSFERFDDFYCRCFFSPSLAGFERKDPFWPLCFEDFIYLTQQFESASDFCLYIERRLAANFKLNPEEEISEGALLLNYRENQLLQLYQDRFCEYKDRLQGLKWELPPEKNIEIQKLDQGYQSLITNVEQSKQKGSLEVCSFLLKLPLPYQRRLMKMFNLERQSFLQDGKGHGFSRFFNEFSVGVTLFCANQQTLDSFWGKMYQYINKKVKQVECEQWILITEVFEKGKAAGYDFRIYRGMAPADPYLNDS